MVYCNDRCHQHTTDSVGASKGSWADVVRGTGNMVARREANDKLLTDVVIISGVER